MTIGISLLTVAVEEVVVIITIGITGNTKMLLESELHGVRHTKIMLSQIRKLYLFSATHRAMVMDIQVNLNMEKQY